MFCNEVGGAGVQTASEETRHDEVSQCPHPHESDNDHIKDNLNNKIDQMPHRGCLVPYDPWPKGIEKYLERTTYFEIRVRRCWRLLGSDSRKENLPKDVVEENQLQPRREVGINSIFSEVFVMLKVVPLDRRQTRLRDHRMQLTLKAEQ